MLLLHALSGGLAERQNTKAVAFRPHRLQLNLKHFLLRAVWVPDTLLAGVDAEAPCTQQPFTLFL